MPSGDLWAILYEQGYGSMCLPTDVNYWANYPIPERVFVSSGVTDENSVHLYTWGSGWQSGTNVSSPDTTYAFDSPIKRIAYGISGALILTGDFDGTPRQ